MQHFINQLITARRLQLTGYAAAFALLGGLVSCAKEKAKTPVVPVSEYLQKIVPYTDGQTFLFMSSEGDEIEVRAQVEKNSITVPSCENCDIMHEVEYMSYILWDGAKMLAKITVDNRPRVFMAISSPLSDYVYGANFDFSVAEDSDDAVCEAQACKMFTLNGHIFSNCIEIRNGAGPHVAYYSVEKGIVGFTYNDGPVYFLVK